MRIFTPSLLGASLGSLLAVSTTGAAPLWTVEETSDLRFTASQQGQPVEGRFKAFDATVAFDPEDLGSSRIEVEIEMESVSTAHSERDMTLRSTAFFDVAKWPTSRFVSDEIVPVDGTGYEAVGRLQIRDVEEPARLPFQLVVDDHPEDSTRLVAQAEGELAISRLTYGVGQGEWASTQTIGDEVIIRIAIVASRPR